MNCYVLCEPARRTQRQTRPVTRSLPGKRSDAIRAQMLPGGGPAGAPGRRRAEEIRPPSSPKQLWLVSWERGPPAATNGPAAGKARPRGAPGLRLSALSRVWKRAALHASSPRKVGRGGESKRTESGLSREAEPRPARRLGGILGPPRACTKAGGEQDGGNGPAAPARSPLGRGGLWGAEWGRGGRGDPPSGQRRCEASGPPDRPPPGRRCSALRDFKRALEAAEEAPSLQGLPHSGAGRL